MGEAENTLKRDILDYLQKLGHTVWNVNVGRIRGRYKTGVPGMPDIQGYHKTTGTAIFIEAKILPNLPTQDQRLFLYNATCAGCIAPEAYSLDDVVRDVRFIPR